MILYLPAVSSVRVTKNEYNARPTRAITRCLLSPTPLLVDAFVGQSMVLGHRNTQPRHEIAGQKTLYFARVAKYIIYSGI